MRTFTTLSALLLLFLQGHAQSAFDQAILLDGSGEYVAVQHQDQLSFQGPFTLELRVWSEDYDQGSWQEFVFKGGNNPPGQPRQYLIRPESGTGRAQFQIYDGNGDHQSAKSDEPMENGACYHIAGVYTGSVMLLYLNGYLVDVDSTGVMELSESMEPLTFGRLGSENAEYFNGSLDEVRLWNTARTAEQVMTTRDDTLSAAYYATPDSGLVGYWRLDEATGELAEDLSAFGNHGTRFGGVPEAACAFDVSINEPRSPGPWIEGIRPDPFQQEAEMIIRMDRSDRVIVQIMDAEGRLIATPFNGRLSAGSHRHRLDGSALRPGHYMVRISSSTGFSTARFTLVR